MNIKYFNKYIPDESSFIGLNVLIKTIVYLKALLAVLMVFFIESVSILIVSLTLTRAYGDVVFIF